VLSDNNRTVEGGIGEEGSGENREDRYRSHPREGGDAGGKKEDRRFAFIVFVIIVLRIPELCLSGDFGRNSDT
jgi:hypothetical protein